MGGGQDNVICKRRCIYNNIRITGEKKSLSNFFPLSHRVEHISKSPYSPQQNHSQLSLKTQHLYAFFPLASPLLLCWFILGHSHECFLTCLGVSVVLPLNPYFKQKNKGVESPPLQVSAPEAKGSSFFRGKKLKTHIFCLCYICIVSIFKKSAFETR